MKADEIANIVKSNRQQSGLSQVGLADLAGVGKTVIYDIEKGKETVQVNTLMRVLDALNIRVKLISPLETHEEHDE
ncbi:MAG TPA: helix-turn-helix transcriptional regulator [Gammaproteobacteria bacterium]|nr:helix-turn-helix transcriptional regulator [Gammaproteobacteria bacterium]